FLHLTGDLDGRGGDVALSGAQLGVEIDGASGLVAPGLRGLVQPDVRVLDGALLTCSTHHLRVPGVGLLAELLRISEPAAFDDDRLLLSHGSVSLLDAGAPLGPQTPVIRRRA